jgi:hypothetical protein
MPTIGEGFVFRLTLGQIDVSDPIHIWVVLNNPRDDDVVVRVNLTSFHPDKDCTCVLEPGDHPLIRHRTLLNYPKAQLSKASVIAHNLHENRITALQNFPSEVFQKIKQGGLETTFLSEKLKRYLR